uniref:Tesmin/TSO1-like CXC domain-containing protein n=1 Tax=Photinus pyralis TaxID=7054 RepID=A0A1Y1MNM3_PHOPY
MVYFKSTRATTDIKATVKKYQQIIPYLPAAHCLSGCDTVAQYHGIGKKTIIKKLEEGFIVKYLSKLDSNLKDVFKECTDFIAACHNVKSVDNMTAARLSVWAKKVGHAQLKAPSFASLPPTTESFCENVKRAHLQMYFWMSAQNLVLPKIDVTQYGREKDDENKILNPISVPKNTKLAPDFILELAKCSCKANDPCSSNRCGCLSNGVSCSLMCKCMMDKRDENKCKNPLTKFVETAQNESESKESDNE